MKTRKFSFFTPAFLPLLFLFHFLFAWRGVAYAGFISPPARNKRPQTSVIICASFIPSGPGPSLFFLPAPLVLVSPRVVRSCTCHEKRCRAEREKDCMDSKSASPSCNQREKDQPGRRRGNGCLRLPLAYYEANTNIASFLDRRLT